KRNFEVEGICILLDPAADMGIETATMEEKAEEEQVTWRRETVLRDSLNVKLNRTGVENPWFFFGVSYPGALSAWFRLKFPLSTCGSLASSTVVLAVYNYTKFDHQIFLSAGPECKTALQDVTNLVDQGLASNTEVVNDVERAPDDPNTSFNSNNQQPQQMKLTVLWTPLSL
ncbi:Probable serine protease EDA2, partial [Linum perenne]